MPALFVMRWKEGCFEEMRRLPQMDAALSESARKVKEACGNGYETDGATPGRSRSRAGVWTQTAEAMVDNGQNNTLLNNLDAGRL